MSDVPALWINGGILVLTGVMALVAFVQARTALTDAGKADKARERAENAEAKAVAAQEASAEALAEANRIAADAGELLRKQDEREREYRDVEWRAMYDARAGGFKLLNVGVTDAIGVTLVLRGFQGGERYDLGDIPSQGCAVVDSAAAAVWMEENEDRTPIAPPYVVHWSSPLGVAEQREAPESFYWKKFGEPRDESRPLR